MKMDGISLVRKIFACFCSFLGTSQHGSSHSDSVDPGISSTFELETTEAMLRVAAKIIYLQGIANPSNKGQSHRR